MKVVIKNSFIHSLNNVEIYPVITRTQLRMQSTWKVLCLYNLDMFTLIRILQGQLMMILWYFIKGLTRVRNRTIQDLALEQLEICLMPFNIL